MVAVFHVGIVGDGVEWPLQDVRLHPAAEAREVTVPVAERGRKIPPGTTASGDPQHGPRQPVVLDAATGIARLAKTQRLHLRALGANQNKSVHPKLELQPSPDENPETKQTLVQAGAICREFRGLSFG